MLVLVIGDAGAHPEAPRAVPLVASALVGVFVGGRAGVGVGPVQAKRDAVTMSASRGVERAAREGIIRRHLILPARPAGGPGWRRRWSPAVGSGPRAGGSGPPRARRSP